MEAEDRLSFGRHQAMEYVAGVFILVTAPGLIGDSAVQAIAIAAVLLALPALSDGPLGAWRVFGRSFHRVLDVVLIMLLAASPLLLHFGDITMIFLVEGLAFGLAILCRRTSYIATPGRSRRRGPAPPAPAPSPPSPEPPAPEGTTATSARAAGFVLGRLSKEGPRRLGRIVGKHKRPPG